MGNTEPPDITATRLQELAAQVQSAQARLTNAERSLAQDKAGRNVLARVADAVSETPAEQAVAAARAELARHRDAAELATRAWLDLRTREHLAQDRTASPWSTTPALRHLDLIILVPRLRVWHRLATEAIAVMELAASQCRPTGDREDLAFPGPSILSAGVTPLAANSVDAAMAAIAKLRNALPEEDFSIDLDGLNDIVHRLIDYLRQPVFVPGHISTYWALGRERPGVADVNKHGQIAEKLEMMARMLVPLSVYLAQLANRAEADIARADEPTLQLIAAHRAAAWDELPAALKGLANQAPALPAG